MSKGFIVTITGPSCGGKSTLEKLLVGGLFENVISTTTRKPRSGEVDGREYHFTSNTEFNLLIGENAFVEYVCFDDHYYGVSAREIERITALGRPIVIVVEPYGQQQIEDWAGLAGYDVFSVFLNGAIEVRYRRFLERVAAEAVTSTMGSTDSLEKRLSNLTRRLITMTTVEADWVKRATLTAQYSMMVEIFNKDTQEFIKSKILSAYSEWRQRELSITS